MTTAAWITLATALLTLFLLVRTRIKMDAVFIMCMAILLFTGVLSEEQTFRGFVSRGALVIVFLGFVVAAMANTGALHWRILASAGYARLHTNEEFLADIAAARAEYAKLAAGGTRINTPKSVNTTRSAAIYNMAGEQLNDNPNTDVYIQNGKKYIKKAE